MSIFSPYTRVAVLRGGPSAEYDISLKTGENILATLREMPDIYDPLDVFISRDGEWHSEGLVGEPHQILSHVDVVWNALHGAYGEDGQVQRMLDSMKISYTGSGAVASALAMNKEMAKRLYVRCNLLTPAHTLITQDYPDNEDQLVFIFQNYLHPVIVKPANSGNSLGVRITKTFQDLKQAVKETFKYSPKVIVEEFIHGKETTCTVAEGVRGERIYALLPTGRLNVENNK